MIAAHRRRRSAIPMKPGNAEANRRGTKGKKDEMSPPNSGEGVKTDHRNPSLGCM